MIFLPIWQWVHNFIKVLTYWFCHCFANKSSENPEECLLVGEIVGRNQSLAALDVCNGYKVT